MKTVGITGGVGAGKSSVLKMLSNLTRCEIIMADDLAKELEKRGNVCYEPLRKLLGDDILGDDLEIDKARMAAVIFARDASILLDEVEHIVHPAVKDEIVRRLNEAKSRGDIDYFFVEAALLIEERYDLILDELWYVYASVETRSKRLMASRGYSDDKIAGIMANQLDEDTYRKYCKVVIDNDRDEEFLYDQLKKLVGEQSGVR